MSSQSAESETGGVIADNLRNALRALIGTLRPSLVLYVHVVDNAPEASALSALLAEAAIDGSRLVFLPDAGKGAPDRGRLADLLEHNKLQAGLVVFSASLPLEHCLVWASIAEACLTEGGMMIGAHPLSEQRDQDVQDLARTFRHNVTLGADYWFSTPYLRLTQPFPVQLLGSTESFKLTSLEDDLENVADRDVFLSLTRAGIPCRHTVEGGVAYRNVPGMTMKDGVLQAPDFVDYFPSNETGGVTDGGFLAYARDLRVQGGHALLYSRHDTLYKESYLATAHRHLDLVGPWDPMISKHDAGLSSPVHATFFPRQLRIRDEVVVVNFPDLHCYNHWISYTLSKFWYLDAFPELADLPIVMSPLTVRFQREYLDLLGISQSKRFIFYDKSVCYRLDRAYVPTILERPYHTGAGVRWVRDKLLPHAAAVPEGYEDGLYYVTRRNQSRGILNEDDLIAYLEGQGFKCLDWAQYSVREQIALARNAKAVVVPFGSGVSNLIFASPGLRCLYINGVGHPELGEKAIADWSVFTVAELDGKAYHAPADQSEFAALPHSVAPMRVDMARFKPTLERMMADRSDP